MLANSIYNRFINFKKTKLRSRKSSLICAQYLETNQVLRTESRSTLEPTAARERGASCPTPPRLDLRGVYSTARTGPTTTGARLADMRTSSIDPVAWLIHRCRRAAGDHLHQQDLADPGKRVPLLPATTRAHLPPATLPVSLLGHHEPPVGREDTRFFIKCQ